MKKIVFTFIFLGLLVISLSGYTQDAISQIQIEGNDLVSDAKIVSEIKVKAGQPFNENIVNEDIKNLYQTGFFQEVSTETKKGDQGLVLIFKVKEKPVVNKITIEGQRYIRKKHILDEISLNEGSFVDDYRMNQAVKKIEDLYTKKGFSQAVIDYQLIPTQDQKVDVKFSITEKGVVKVRSVKIKGNKSFSDDRIKKLMKTRRAWLFNKGIFKEEVFEDDLKRIKGFYQHNGFTDVSVDSEVDFRKKGVYINLTINQGKKYYIGKIEITGNKEIDTAKIRKKLTIAKGDVFSKEAVYQGSSQIRQLYVDKGYIFAQAEPVSVLNPETKKIDITYDITESHIAYVEDIQIKGNEKTKGEVIRRELKVYPGEKFDGEKMRESKQDLENLGFFEDIRFRTEPGSEKDKVDLVVDVTEAKTGYFSFGGGYSSIEEFIGFVELRQRNFDYQNWQTFTGAGQDLTLKASLGTLTSRYQLSFTNPWIFDQPISFGFDAYKKGHDQDDDVGYAYSEDITGGALRLGKEFTDKLSGRVLYRFENVDISDVVSDASQDLKDEAGSNNLSSTELSIAYDTRDNIFSPSKGVYFSNSLQLTGSFLGGDKNFTKFFSRLSLYFPMVNDSVVETRFKVGFADPFSDTDKVPIYERFFAGGASTIRGYRERKVGPIDKGNSDDPLGGEALFVANFEYTYPLADFLKVATFYDIGNVWSKNDDFFKDEGGREALYSSIGIGLRVKTPIGPVSVDYGWPLDKEPGEDGKEGRFHFSVSRGF
ncbi:MAG: outer membrane protein assembly factor BamA [Candidatus Omnitrophica bacterium]|nr:outer membrane protein assembly factor BamA [Candidatus Omnitrophota bacterium]MCF7893467.1 outer membrane protein assembly factor BamA [Candidatus Omnitrophota bacterium]